MSDALTSVRLPVENAYGHGKRLEWIASRLSPQERVVEIGCGTGYMVTLPLAARGQPVIGLDRDTRSIEFGRKLLRMAGLSPDHLRDVDLDELGFEPDALILSEVLEHNRDEEVSELLGAVRRVLRPGGKLFITVPNGYGWFELESYLWFRAGAGRLLERVKVYGAVRRLKRRLLGEHHDQAHPSTFDSSPHVQRFTHRSIRRVLEANGFVVREITGSVLFAGPFSNWLFTGFGPVMRINGWLGGRFPRIASGFYVACELPNENSDEAVV